MIQNIFLRVNKVLLLSLLTLPLFGFELRRPVEAPYLQHYAAYASQRFTEECKMSDILSWRRMLWYTQIVRPPSRGVCKWISRTGNFSSETF
jgi:hypothetical protein